MLRMFRRIAAKAATLVGHSGVFVKPTSSSGSSNNGAGMYGALSSAYDGDINTGAAISVQYMGVSVTARFVFDALLPAGARLTIRWGGWATNNVPVLISSLDNSLTTKTILINQIENLSLTDCTYELSQATKAIEFTITCLDPTNVKHSFTINDIKVEL